ncbi:MAG: peptide chain release factor N(5)-glutamine methyltransferase [Candidatus Moraniibacteriota bacterium]
MKNVKNTIEDIKLKYLGKLDSLDLDLLISFVLKKEREFILAHPEYLLTSKQQSTIDKVMARRLKNEPLSYILGEKEFYGLNFKVNQHTLIPRPETELMVELALEEILKAQYPILNTIDIGTGSGNIIISLAHQLKNTSYQLPVTNYLAIDISKEAIKIAKQNAKFHNLNKQIKFLHGNLLEPIVKSKIINHKSSLLILANLPYLSKDIYNACAENVKKYEPRTALYSATYGLAHYEELLGQIKLLIDTHQQAIVLLIEISPEQKKLLPPLIKKYFPQAQLTFIKDLTQRWRFCKIILK